MEPETEHTRTDFTNWWLQTEFGMNKDIQNNIHWDHKKRASVWEYFDQVAHERTGEPKVMCKRCHTVLVHPNVRRGGTSPIKAHLKGNTYHSMSKRGINKLVIAQVS